MKEITSINTEATGLQKLTQEQLINIILRKDNLEQKLSAEVRKLCAEMKKLKKQIGTRRTAKRNE